MQFNQSPCGWFWEALLKFWVKCLKAIPNCAQKLSFYHETKMQKEKQTDLISFYKSYNFWWKFYVYGNTNRFCFFVFCFNSFEVSKTFLFRNGTNALNVYILPIPACSSSLLSLARNSKKRQYQNKSNNWDVQLRTKNLNSRLWMRKIWGKGEGIRLHKYWVNENHMTHNLFIIQYSWN